jgi:hypothetical protein
MKISNFPFIILSICLFFIFIFPFVLRTKRPVLEIYPSVNLPAGAALVNTDNIVFTSYKTVLYGFRENKAIPIDSKIFFDPIPNQYRGAILNNFFGLEPISKTHILFKPDISFTKRNKYSIENVEETKSWMREKLISQNMADSVILVRKIEIEYNSISQSTISKANIDERVIRLR